MSLPFNMSRIVAGCLGGLVFLVSTRGVGLVKEGCDFSIPIIGKRSQIQGEA